MTTIRKAALLAGAGSLLLSSPVLAQQQRTPTPESPPSQTDQADATEVDAIVVTGSRIVRDGYQAPTPVTVATSEDLLQATPTSLPEALNKLPQLLGSSGPGRTSPNFANTANHGNILNLRGVGGQRTLILFNGLRVPATTYTGAVDTNVLPQLLVSRVDVVTAGASAAYGSDAVAGVINFVLDERFDGFKGVVQYGSADDGEGKSYRLGVAGGRSFAAGRGHAEVSAERFESREILRSARSLDPDSCNGIGGWSAVGSVVGSASAPGTAGNPLVFRNCVTNSIAAEGGRITGGPAGTTGLRFAPDGTTVPYVFGTPTGTAGSSVGGDGLYLHNENTTLSAPLTTNQVFGRVSYELNERIELFAQANYAQTETHYSSQAPAYFGARIYAGNAYLPDNLRSALAAASTPTAPAFFTLSKTLPDRGGLQNDEATDSGMFTVGMKGSTSSSWSWDLAYTRGESTTDVDVSNTFEIVKLSAALDAVTDGGGNIVCRVTLTNPGLYPGCVPINPFGYGSETDAAFDYVTGVSSYHTETTSDNFAGSVQGNLFTLPAGPISVVLGGEYRRQSLKLISNADPAIAQNFAGLRAITTGLKFFSSNVGEASGSVEVKEAFAEISVPILSDVIFARSLEINAAARVTDYSTSGRVETWKVGGTWEPMDGLLLRATRSHDIRAPSLFDLFAGAQSGVGSFPDPHTLTTSNYQLIQSGNPALSPETADTFTAGFVISPAFLPGFSLSVDYFDLKIEGAIAAQTAFEVVTDCERSGGAAAICDDVVRPLPFSDRTAANFPTLIRVQPRNIAFLETRGWDIDASYRREVGPGKLALRLYATYTDSYITQQSATLPEVDYAGTAESGFGRPKLRSTLSANYTAGPWSVFAQGTYIGAMRHGPTLVFAEPELDPVTYTDLTVNYELPTQAKIQLFATAANLFDKRPPIAASNSLPGVAYPTVFSLYDTVGRTITAGARFQF